MTRITGVVICYSLVSCAAYAQTIAARPEFEVENVKLNKSGTAEHTTDVSRSGEVFFRNITIAELLPLAFQRKPDLIAGMPAWFTSEHYDIAAKATPNIPEATLGLMFQSLLAREFKLTFHEEPRPADAYALVVANGGAKLRAVPADPARPGCAIGAAREQAAMECSSATIADLIPRLLFTAQDYIDRPVVDQTGMTGTYEIKLTWTPQRLIETAGGLTVFDALTKQLGLKLDQRKLPVPVIVIDHAERLTEN